MLKDHNFEVILPQHKRSRDNFQLFYNFWLSIDCLTNFSCNMSNILYFQLLQCEDLVAFLYFILLSLGYALFVEI